MYEYAIHNKKEDDMEDLHRLSVQTFVQDDGYFPDTHLMFFSDGSVFDGAAHNKNIIERGKAYKTMQEWLDVKIKQRGKPLPRRKREKKVFKKRNRIEYDPEFNEELDDYMDLDSSFQYDPPF
jgi:hypothetical protein